jgi:hypothetical protein
LNYYAFKATADVPSEHVIVFDEAQRAWDGERMAFKDRGSRSEAELMLGVMARRPGWSVIVALVGFGQEIHQVEAGLQEWGRAIRKCAPTWSIIASPTVVSADCSKDGACLFNESSAVEVSVEIDPALHLAVSIRSTRAQPFSSSGQVAGFLPDPLPAARCVHARSHPSGIQNPSPGPDRAARKRSRPLSAMGLLSTAGGTI